MPIPGRDPIQDVRLIWDETEPHTYGACPDTIPPPQTAGPPTVRLTLNGAGGPLCTSLLAGTGRPPLVLASPALPEVIVPSSVLAEVWEGWFGSINAGTEGRVNTHYVRIARLGEEPWVVAAYLLVRLADDSLHYLKYFHGGGTDGFSTLIAGGRLTAYNRLQCSPPVPDLQAVFQSGAGSAIIKAGV